MAYKIKGEAGKALNTTVRVLGDELKVISASLSFVEKGIDKLEWKALTADLIAAETILPQAGQIVELYQDTTRYFRGWVKQPVTTNYGAAVTIEGPAKWLHAEDVATVKTIATGSAERPTITFATGDVATHINTLLGLAIAKGLPIAIGTIATGYAIPKLKLSLMSYAAVLAKLLEYMPDCVAWWNYSGTGTPTYNVSRRAAMASVDYTVNLAPLEKYEVAARPDLVPSRVELKYVTRQANGLPLYQVQAAGVAAAGKVQTLLISGDEGDTFLPKDSYESYTVSTGEANTTAGALETTILPMLPEVQASRASFPGRPDSGDITLSNGDLIVLSSGIGAGSTNRYFQQPYIQFLNPDTGAPISRIGKYFVLGEEPPEWAGNLLANREKVKIVGRIYVLEQKTLHNATNTQQKPAADPPAWQLAFPWSTAYGLDGYLPITTPIGWPWAYVWLLALDFEIETYLTTTPYYIPQTFYKPQEFEYLTPPAGLATNLLNAQATTPYEGKLELSYDDAPPLVNAIQTTVNILGGQVVNETMEAQVSGITYDLKNFTAQLALAPPSRFPLNGKISRSAQANITIN